MCAGDPQRGRIPPFEDKTLLPVAFLAIFRVKPVIEIQQVSVPTTVGPSRCLADSLPYTLYPIWGLFAWAEKKCSYANYTPELRPIGRSY